MYIADAKRLTHDGARKMMATAIDKAREAKIAISCCIVDAGGHVVVLERMDGGRFHTLHSCTTKAVCAASNKRATTAKGAVGQDLDVTHALGLALAAGPERWTAMEGGVPILVDGECIGGVGVSGGDWADRPEDRAGRGRGRSARAGNSIDDFEPLRVACIGMGWWSDVLADAIKRSDKIKIVACFTRSEDKRAAFAKKYGCRPVASYEEVLADPDDRGDHQHHAERRASADHARRRPRPASTCSSTSRSPTTSPKAAPSPRSAARPAWCSAWAISGGARAISAG